MWGRIDDGWWSHPKVLGLSMGARGLWITALSWSCQHHRPHVPARLLDVIGAGTELADELVDAGLWIRDDDGTGWTVHDWSTYQRPDLYAARVEAGRKGGQASGEARRSKQTKQPFTKQRSNRSRSNEPGPPRPAPTRPVPTAAAASEANGSSVDDAVAVLARARGFHKINAARTQLDTEGVLAQLVDLAARFPAAPGADLAQMLDHGPLFAQYVNGERTR
jgi:hypothetical protein